MSNDHGFVVDQDLLDHQSQDALPVLDRRAGGCITELREEALQRLSEFEVALLIDEPRLQGIEISLQARSLRAESGHATGRVRMIVEIGSAVVAGPRGNSWETVAVFHSFHRSEARRTA